MRAEFPGEATLSYKGTRIGSNSSRQGAAIETQAGGKPGAIVADATRSPIPRSATPQELNVVVQFSKETAIRNAVERDYPAICALNLAEVQQTSPMDAIRLAALGKMACYFRVVCLDGIVKAFLLAMCHGAAYENDNFRWFSSRYPQFIYIDRVVVSPASRGMRLGSSLYEDLFRYARAKAIPWVTCEFNIIPPNEPSRLFHEKFGFRELDTQWVANDTKKVSLQAAAT
jgi:predicted GNAT superfamily acetyltransferase